MVLDKTPFYAEMGGEVSDIGFLQNDSFYARVVDCQKMPNGQHLHILNDIKGDLIEDIEVNAQIMVCADCGEELFNEELDSKTLICAYNEYRRKHKLLFPEEIKRIREQYGLSQRSFAKLLNWGDKTIHRYENGAIQDRVHNSLLLFLHEPENMRTYLLENEVTIDEKQKARLLETVESTVYKGLHRVTV